MFTQISLADTIIERFIQILSFLIRNIPINRKIKDICIEKSLSLKEYRFDFTFKCNRIGVTWSASGFPDLMTRHMMFEGMYQEDVLVTLRSIIKEGDVVFDVGGHHGLMAIISRMVAGPSGKIVTFEPNPKARVYMEKHFALNSISDVIIEKKALSDKEGEIPFYIQIGDVTWNSTIIKEFVNIKHDSERIMIKTMTLDHYVSETGLIPKVIKIDVEGSDFLILKGAEETLKKYRPALIMEFNPESAHAAQITTHDFIEFLRKESYKLYVLQSNFWGYYKFSAQELFDEEKHFEHNNIVNVFCVPL